MKPQWTIVVIAVVIIGLGLGFFIFQLTNQPEKVVKQFQKAVEEEDSELLASLLVVEDENEVVDQHRAEAIIQYLKKNNHSYEVLREHFYDQIERDYYNATSQQLNLRKSDSRLFPSDEIMAKTIELRVTGVGKDDSFRLSYQGRNESLEPSDDGRYGPLLPGTYSFQVMLENKLGLFQDTVEKELWGSDTITLHIDEESIVQNDEHVQNELVHALQQFNMDYSIFTTSGLDLEVLTNISNDFRESEFAYLASAFFMYRNVIESIESKYIGAVADISSLKLKSFSGNWRAEIEAFVQYEERVKFIDEEVEDTSFEAIRHYALIYDEEKEEWLIDSFTDEEAESDIVAEWDNKKVLEVEEPTLERWSNEGETTL